MCSPASETCGELEREFFFHSFISPFQPLEKELNKTSEEVRKTTKQVEELREAVLLAQKAEEEEGGSQEEEGGSQEEEEGDYSLNEPVKSLTDDVSAVNLLVDLTTSCDVSSYDMSSFNPSSDSSTLTNPALQDLAPETEILLPEKLETSPQANSYKTESSSQCLSQELF